MTDATYVRVEPAATASSLPVVSNKTAGRRIIGALSLVGLVASWVAQAEVAQYVQTGASYNKPYLLVWLNHVWMALLLPIQCIIHCITRRPHEHGWLTHVRGVHGVSFKKLFNRCVALATLYFIADYVWYLALPYTSVAAGTAIFNSSCVFAYLFSVCILREAVVPLKVLSIIIALGGVVMVSLAPGEHKASDSEVTSTQQLIGNLCVAACAVLYAAYEVLFKKALGDIKDAGVVNTITAYIGLLTMIFLWIGLIVVNYLPSSWSIVHEPFELPDGVTFGYLVANGALALAFNLCFMTAIALTSPLMASASGVMAIPISGVVDYVSHGDTFGVVAILGSFAIITGFALLTYAEFKHLQPSSHATNINDIPPTTAPHHAHASP